MIKKGDKYLCKLDLFNGSYKGFRKGNVYESFCNGLLTGGDSLEWIINDSHLKQHFTNLQEVNNIEVKAEIVTPKHYNNENGTLYSIAEQRGWNSYLFDIVKRLERADKKGEFNQDLEKSIAVIQLWQKESVK